MKEGREGGKVEGGGEEEKGRRGEGRQREERITKEGKQMGERRKDGGDQHLLEDLSQHPVSFDAFYVLYDDGLFFVSLLFLQPLHHSLVIVPEVRLQGGRGHLRSSTSQTSEHCHTPASYQ